MCQDDCPDNCPHNCTSKWAPQVHNIRFERIHATGNRGIPTGKLQCRPESPCTGITMSDIRFPRNHGGGFDCNGHAQGTAAGVDVGAVRFENERPISALCRGGRDST